MAAKLGDTSNDHMPREGTVTDKKLMTYEEAAGLLGLHLGTLYSMVSRRQIPHLRLGARLVRFDPVELEAWLSERRVASMFAKP